MNYQINKFSKFFEPNVEEIAKYNLFLKQTNENLAMEKAMHPLLSGGGSSPALLSSTTPKKTNRVLEEKKEATKTEFIYRPGLSAKVALDSWKKDFAPEGLSMLNEGEASNINEALFNSIKTELQLARENKGSQASAMLTSVEQDANKKNNRELKNAGIVKVVMFIVAILFLK